jgi:hypothetical protein
VSYFPNSFCAVTSKTGDEEGLRNDKNKDECPLSSLNRWLYGGGYQNDLMNGLGRIIYYSPPGLHCFYKLFYLNINSDGKNQNSLTTFTGNKFFILFIFECFYLLIFLGYFQNNLREGPGSILCRNGLIIIFFFTKINR